MNTREDKGLYNGDDHREEHTYNDGIKAKAHYTDKNYRDSNEQEGENSDEDNNHSKGRTFYSKYDAGRYSISSRSNVCYYKSMAAGYRRNDTNRRERYSFSLSR